VEAAVALVIYLEIEAAVEAEAEDCQNIYLEPKTLAEWMHQSL
jgi:hypothetical protein